MHDEELLALLDDVAAAVHAAIEGHRGDGLSGARPGQYVVDVLADAAALDVLAGAGIRVLSEESGATGSGELVCVLDPIDGSTNCDRGIPYFSTSACILDDIGMRCALVWNHPTATAYRAVRGRGATRDGEVISTSGATRLEASMISFSGLPPASVHLAQFRALGSASLELCAVADGSLDAFSVAAHSILSPWDYLGGMLMVQEAGGTVLDALDEHLVEAAAVVRHPIAAATRGLADDLRAALHSAKDHD